MQPATDLLRINDIEARQEEVLRQLEDLERQIAAALREYGGEQWLRVVAPPAEDMPGEAA